MNTRMPPTPLRSIGSAQDRLAAWLKALRENARAAGRRTRVPSCALDILAHNLPCRNADAKSVMATPCPGVVSASDADGRLQPFSFPCPCKHYGQTLSKYDALALVTLPWEQVSRDGHASSSETAPWTVCEEENILAHVARSAFARFGRNAFVASVNPYDALKDALDERQRGSARELGGFERAARVVRDETHVVVAWSLVKDAYLSEFTSVALSPSFTRQTFADGLPAGAHAVVAFDALMLKGYGARAPEMSALGAFIEDLFDRRCTLEGVSRYPLLGAPSQGIRRRGGADDVDALQGFDGGRRAVRDERGRLRVTRRKDESALALAFENALDHGDFEKLAQMIVEGRRVSTGGGR